MAKYSKINFIEPEKLIPYEKNTKKHPDGQLTKLARLMENYGFPESKAILVDENLIIVAGHGRRLASISAGLKQVPYQIITDISEADKKALRIADNAVAESEWDYDLLKQEYQDLELEDFDMNLLSLDDIHFEAMDLKLHNVSDENIMEWDDAFDKVKEGDKDSFQQMTFTVHDDQKAIIDEALDMAKKDSDYDESLNGNSNGNALFILANYYLTHVS